MTEVVPTSNLGQLIASSATLTELFQVFIEASQPQAAVDTRSAPVVPYVTAQEEDAFGQLTTLLTETVFPTEVSLLTDEETEGFLELRDQLDLAIEASDRIKESIREAMFNHFDLLAEARGLITDDVLVDKKGHYVLPDTEHGGSDTSAKKFTREVRRGKSTYGEAVTEADRLKALVDQGLLDHKDYLRLTRPARVVDEDKAMMVIKKRPELLEALRAVVQSSASSASLYVRSNATE